MENPYTSIEYWSPLNIPNFTGLPKNISKSEVVEVRNIFGKGVEIWIKHLYSLLDLSWPRILESFIQGLLGDTRWQPVLVIGAYSRDTYKGRERGEREVRREQAIGPFGPETMLMNLACHYLNCSQYATSAEPSIELGITTARPMPCHLRLLSTPGSIVPSI